MLWLQPSDIAVQGKHSSSSRFEASLLHWWAVQTEPAEPSSWGGRAETCSMFTAPMGNLAAHLSVFHQRLKALQIKQKLQIKTLSPGRSPAPILLSQTSLIFRLAFLHMLLVWPLSPSTACSWGGLAATWDAPDPPLPLTAPQPLHHVHTSVLTSLFLYGHYGHHPLSPSCPPTSRLSTVPKYRLDAAGARAFGSCSPRLWNSLSADHSAKHRLQHLSLLKHVRQHSRRICPLDPTALYHPRRGKDVFWRRLLPFQLPANTRIGILCPFFHPLSTLGSCFCSEFTAIQVSLATISHVWSSQVSNRAKLLLNVRDLFVLTWEKKGE